MKKVVLINGKKRSGKDYFANLLKDELNKNGKTADIFAFADPIKDILCTSFNIELRDFDNFKNDPKTFSVDIISHEALEVYHITNMREIIQHFGTEAMKKWFGEDVWVKLMLKQIYESEADFVIVPDFRFLVEDLGIIFDINTTPIKIINNDVETNDSHRSENELNNFYFMYTVDNTGYKDLTADVQKITSHLISLNDAQ